VLFSDIQGKMNFGEKSLSQQTTCARRIFVDILENLQSSLLGIYIKHHFAMIPSISGTLKDVSYVM
jgi:hypothetical protein